MIFKVIQLSFLSNLANFYPFSALKLTGLGRQSFVKPYIKQGILSSKYTKAEVKYLQVDSSVNQGNSGGLLINFANNEVIGIVTRKHTGLTKFFDEMINSFNSNIALLEKVKGLISMSGIDLGDALVVSQRQMEITSQEIIRSANVGIGYAYELEQIQKFFHK